MALPGISTVGIKLGYAVGDLGAANKPNAFALLTRIHNIDSLVIHLAFWQTYKYSCSFHTI